MFTGLVEQVGEVVSLARSAGMVTAGVGSGIEAAELSIGESICIDGYCQTVVKVEKGVFYVEISPETLARTTAGSLRVGRKVNLERALRLSDRLGGHLVAGHVDGVGKVLRITQQGDFRVFLIRIPRNLSRYVIEKGSAAVDGISLTVNRIEGDGMELGIIPHTMAGTTLPFRKAGDEVNIEVDLIGKYVERLLSGNADSGGVTRDLLRKHGFA